MNYNLYLLVVDVLLAQGLRTPVMDKDPLPTATMLPPNAKAMPQ